MTAAELLLDDLRAIIGDPEQLGAQLDGQINITVYTSEGRQVKPPAEVQIAQTVAVIFIYKIGESEAATLEMSQDV